MVYLVLLASDAPDSLEDCRLSCLLLEDGEVSAAAEAPDDVTAARSCCGGRLAVIRPFMASTSVLSSSPSPVSSEEEEGRR